MLDEIWTETGYPGYTVSSLGRVRGRKGRVMRTKIRRQYLTLNIYVKGIPKTMYLHTLVCESFHGPRPEGMQVRHLDGDNENCRADNLKWGTARDQIQDRIDQGRSTSSRVLTDDDVALIKSSTEPARKLAEELGVSRGHVQNIRLGLHRPLT